ncbi:UNKNOWN [Stylonychia lemnae]|uniref:Uncharacterized protein n=1 Tax=Stylonychia lemnae TaxID=5949 RepID=A0A078AJR4_STYLE|nr:UNKNOWN [Stylonychia lemnae]|eukprot:CDW82409.1 UNKNOWN [Stylonychia lemnae]
MINIIVKEDKVPNLSFTRHDSPLKKSINQLPFRPDSEEDLVNYNDESRRTLNESQMTYKLLKRVQQIQALNNLTNMQKPYQNLDDQKRNEGVKKQISQDISQDEESYRA